MAKNKNPSLSDFNKKGFALTEKGLVKADKLVDKKLISKLPPLVNSEGKTYAESMVEAMKKINEPSSYKHYENKRFEPIKTEFFDISAKEQMRLFKESGLVYATTRETFLLPTGDYIDVLYRFDIIPCPAPRMVNSDKWRKRKPVMKYFAFKDELIRQANQMGYKLTETLRILVLVPMPKSWSTKKRAQMNNQPHQQRGDWDNFGKAFCDCLSGEDNFVWDARVIKLWAETGAIIVF